MGIPKPIRVVLYLLVGSALLGLTVVVPFPLIGRWSLLAILFFPIFNLLAGVPVDAIDFWLRDRGPGERGPAADNDGGPVVD